MIKVLHVDDDTDILEITKMSLELAGDIEVVQCESGEQALRTVQDYTPDVLLLDVMMPGMSGPETLDKLRELSDLKCTPAIFMTAHARQGEQQEFIDLGAEKVISKPFDPLTLPEEIRAVVKLPT
jgi:CheY-like chemotaxis protein